MMKKIKLNKELYEKLMNLKIKYSTIEEKLESL